LLRHETTTFGGRFYSADGARTIPGCVQQPRLPFAVAATGPAAMAVVASFAQSWVTTGDPKAEASMDAQSGARTVASQMALLEEACTSAGRDPTTIASMVLTGVGVDPGLSSTEHFLDTVGRYEAVGVTDLVVHWPRDDEPFKGDRDTFEEIFGR